MFFVEFACILLWSIEQIYAVLLTQASLVLSEVNDDIPEDLVSTPKIDNGNTMTPYIENVNYSNFKVSTQQSEVPESGVSFLPCSLISFQKFCFHISFICLLLLVTFAGNGFESSRVNRFHYKLNW